MSAPLTPEQADYFDACIVKWQDKLNLKNWRIERNKRKPAAHKNMADVELSVPDRLASYRLGKFSDSSDVMLDSTALHECLHVLLAPFKFAIEKDLGDDAVTAEEHAIVVFLEKLLMRESS